MVAETEALLCQNPVINIERLSQLQQPLPSSLCNIFFLKIPASFPFSTFALSIIQQINHCHFFPMTLQCLELKAADPCIYHHHLLASREMGHEAAQKPEE